MTYSWQPVAERELGDPGIAPPNFSVSEREHLEEIADRLIPSAGDMPAASAVGVGFGQLDNVLRSRPDLAESLRTALGWGFDGDINQSMAGLNVEDPDAYRALTTVVLAGYYLSAEVRGLLKYPGQHSSSLTISYPEYVAEGLLDAVLERGSLHREPDELGHESETKGDLSD